MLNELGFDNVAMNALFTQKQRLTSLQKFKGERRKILIATDVASRGMNAVFDLNNDSMFELIIKKCYNCKTLLFQVWIFQPYL